MLDWLKGYSVPLSVAVGLAGAVIGGYLWLYSEFVTAGDFVKYQSQIERRILTEKEQQLRAELLKIDVKCQAYPKKCDAVDKALREQLNQDLRRVQRDLGQPQTIRR